MIELRRNHDDMEALFFDLRAFPEVGSRWNRETVKEASQAGARAMRKAIPKKDRVMGVPGLNVKQHHPGKHLQDRVTATLPTYKPGGPGGGGVWEAKAGVPLVADEDDPATFYFRGTGVWGPSHAMIITTPKNMITFEPGAGWNGAGLIHVFQRSVGQRPHPAPLREANRAANNVVRGRIQSLRAKGFGV